MSKKPEVSESDGNIFADLGLDNADEFYTRACLGVQVMKLLKGRSQKDAARLLGVKQRRIHWGKGLRVYFAQDGQTIIILLGGGTKATQARDIQRAGECWTDYKQRRDRGKK